MIKSDVLKALGNGEAVRERARLKWGDTPRILMAVEETAEFIQAAMKTVNRLDKGDLAGEVADSLITLMGVAEIIGPMEVAHIIKQKTDRLEGRL